MRSGPINGLKGKYKGALDFQQRYKEEKKSLHVCFWHILTVSPSKHMEASTGWTVVTLV